MTTLNTIGKGLAWNTVATTAGKIIMFANVFIILTRLSVYEYGLSQLVLSVISIMGILLLPGLFSVLVADLARERGQMNFMGMKSIFLDYVALNVSLGLVAWAALFFGSSIVANVVGNQSIGFFLKIISFSFLLAPWRTVGITLATVELRFLDQAFYSVLEEIAKMAYMLFLFYVLGQGVEGLFYAVVFSQFTAIVLYIPRTMSAYRVFSHAQVSTRAFWRVLRDHRKWSIASSYVGTLGQTVQLWIIRLTLGTEAVGIFSFVDGISSQVASLMPLGSILAPILPRYVTEKNKFNSLMRGAIKMQVVVAGILICATFIGLPVLLYVFPKYSHAVPLLMVMIFILLPNSLISIYTPAFAALQEQFSLFVSSTVKTLLIALLTPVGVALVGLPGIGLADVAILSLSALERTWRFKRLVPTFKMSFRDFFKLENTERELITHVWKRFSPTNILQLFK
ncbi:MAG: hypothetical protein JWO43_267 [Candidatus Adlerbacteria bacterium]|nr:hypothetical protein [Candidatus Adlerbacteria bacterium]